jgi:sugar O-acyltransferase (sialic acid O-acetyltransferase NeuD family)
LTAIADVAAATLDALKDLSVSIVLFGSGASMIVEVEESCARLGVQIVAIVKNVEGRDYALSRELIIQASDITPELAARPYLVAIFTPGHRLAASRDAAARGFRTPTVIVDPSATVARSTTLGEGTYVNAGVVIGAASKIGAAAFINRSASIGHHVEIAEWVSIGPGATVAGAVRIGRGSVIGAGAVILPAVEIGSNAVIAAGAVVRDAVADHCLVAGNPARVIEANYAGYRNLSV